MRGRFYLAALWVAALLALAGCGPSEGDVLDKRWKPDLSYWGTMVSCSGTGKTLSCSTIPHWYYIPADYILILRVPSGDVQDKHVDRKSYYSINVGDHFKEV